MRLIIIPVDKFISIDDVGVHGVDMTWIPEFVGESGISTSVRAVQWYGDHGEIELNSRDNNLVITELGVLEEAITKYEERKNAIIVSVEAALIHEEEEATRKEMQEMESRRIIDRHNSILDIADILEELQNEEDNNVGISTT